VRLTRYEFEILSGLLDVVLDLPESQRSDWLQQLREPFNGAKSVLQQMLVHEASNASTDFFTSFPQLNLRASGQESDPTSEGHPAGTIGIYVLVREIGQGGMSTVWLAHRTDELADRLVALKLPHLQPSAAQFVERFRRERDILAKLSHPHIAHLYDAGVTPQGQPYLVMEYVEGEGLLSYCKLHRLDVPARLDLFLQILQAVDHAHTQGIIHRDIKPSNILVREHGHAVLLDFGIAKLLIDEQAEQSELTQRGGAMLTVPYASPEQLLGSALTLQTDVYSIGVVLFELLSGRRPYERDDGQAISRRDLEHAILALDAIRPSDAARADAAGYDSGLPSRGLRNRLRGDLDTIVLKALRKRPSERYRSCAILAEDLRRHLRGDVVSARPNSNWYRLTRVVKRHRPVLYTAAASAAIAAAMGVTMMYVAPAKGPLSSERGIDKAIAVLPFDNVTGDVTNESFAQGIQSEVLTRLATISGLKVMSRHATADLESHPSQLHPLRETLAVGNVLEGSVQRQGDRVLVSVRLIETARSTSLWAASFDRPVKDLFSVERDIAETVAGHLKAALLPTERAVVEAADTQNADAHTADLWGRFYMAKRDDQSLRKALENFNEAVQLDPNYAMAYADLSAASFYMANSLDEADSEPMKAQARSAARHAIALDPDLPEAHVALGWALLYFDWDVRRAESEMTFAESRWPRSSRAKTGLANVYAVFGKWERAIQLTNEARALDPLSSVLSTNLGNYTLGQGKRGDAAAWYRKALELDQNAPYCHGNLAIIALAQGNASEAARQAHAETDEEWRDFSITLVDQRNSNPMAADRALKEFIGRHERYSPYLVASLYAFRGDANASFAWLDRAARIRDLGAIDFLQSPFFIRFQSDPRYRAFGERLGVMSGLVGAAGSFRYASLKVHRGYTPLNAQSGPAHSQWCETDHALRLGYPHH